MSVVKIIECPRDAMQGLEKFIPTDLKAGYINALLKVGFDTIDFGSFVSPKAIPQLRDTENVLKKLKIGNSKSKLLAIIANLRGAEDACRFEEINFLGFPFSISETFQKRNTNSTIEESLKRVGEIQNLCIANKKEMTIYISMAFGNPYGDQWNKDIAIGWIEKLSSRFDAKIFSLADTIGASDPATISYMFSSLIPSFPHLEFGAHLHTTPETWKEKVSAAFENGCSRFDSAILGLGGCPMAADKLVGNMPTENLISFLKEKNLETGINEAAFSRVSNKALEIFSVRDL